MCDSIRHRGPDDQGIEIREGVGLGMRRLSVIDIAGGKQPIANEDGSLRVVMNGEIYNYRELREELRDNGHHFSTNSDTEVIVHAYEQWGLEAVNRLNGMFAFALHNLRNGHLILARDHLGIKPLFYAVTDDCIVWGSEIKALLGSRRLLRTLNTDALCEFFTWEYVPGSHTLFNEILKLEAGHLLDIDLPSASINDICFWDIPLDGETDTLDFETWTDRVLEQVDISVRRQLVADVPLGAFLSGGVDSSLIASAMHNAETFSIGFRDKSWNELEYSQAVATHLNLPLTSRILESDVAHLFDHLMYFMDDPIGDFSIFPTYLVSKLAREHVTVSLSGDGGDELFGGYETYVANMKYQLYRHCPELIRKSVISPLLDLVPPQRQKKGLINKLKRFSEGAGLSEGLAHARWRVFLGEALRVSLFTPEVVRTLSQDPGEHIINLIARAHRLQPVNQCLYVDTRSYLVDNCLVKTDRMSMAVSLEARVPFLDKDLVEMAFRIPDSYKLQKGLTKAMLKNAAVRRIPRPCVYRPKQGFSIPIKNWLGTQFKPMLEHATARARIEGDGIFNYATVEKLKRNHLSGAANHSHLLWSLIVFDRWKSQWLDGSI